ncbi:MAG: ABC transporter permease [Candidatus Methanomethylophilaceae archaeon]|nr:sulfonate transport system permease protein [Candidatus Methanomethylophilaceae archaeon]
MDPVLKYFVYDKDNRRHRMLRRGIITAVSLVVFVLIWWDLSLMLNNPAIPTPEMTWDALVFLFQNGDSVSGMTMWGHMGISLERFFAGLLLALVIAVPFGLLLGYSDTLNEFSSPTLEVLRPIAPIAWAPIFLFAVGYTWGPILVVFVGIFFPVLTNTMFGVKKIDPNWLDAAKTLGASKVQTFVKVMLPAAVPYIMNGLRIGMGVGWMCIVASELYASFGGGVGYFISIQAQMGYWPNVYAGIVIIAILGILTTSLADYAHKIITGRMGME